MIKDKQIKTEQKDMHEITEQQIEESVKNSEQEEKIEFGEDNPFKIQEDKPITTLNSEEILSDILPVEEQNFVDVKSLKFRA